MRRLGIVLTIALATGVLSGSELSAAQSGALDWMDEAKTALENELVSELGEGQRDRLRRGMGQVADLWREEDGELRANQFRR